MKLVRRIGADERAAAAIEMAFALPVLLIMIGMFAQFAQIYRALAGIQHALGEGARYATLCVSVSSAGCTSPSAAQIKSKIAESVYGAGHGTFTVGDPAGSSSGTARYYDLTVSYSQPTNLLIVEGPTVSVSRSRRVWIAAT